MPGDETTDVDYQLGEHNVDTSAVELGDDPEFIEFEMEAKAVFKRLAEDIYDGAEAGIREPLTNASTAVLRAIEEYGLDPNRGVIEITVRKDADGTRLSIQDNGIGISEGELKEVVSVIGRSANRDRGDLSGKFGMGFLALWMLSGLNGGFFMHTHSRQDGEEPISGVWKSGGFSRHDPDELGGFSEDQYGTRFDIVLKDTIDADHVRDWVAKHAEYCRVPVIYREFDPDGTEVFNEDYGDKSLRDDLSNDHFSLELDTPYFTAICSNEASGKALLLDVPVKRNKSRIYDAPLDEIDIRMKNENGVVVEGPHEGCVPISDHEYREKDDEQQDGFVPESTLSPEDVAMPAPLGTRDKLAENDEFWDWLCEQFEDIYFDTVGEYYHRIDSVDSLFTEFEFSELDHLVDSVSKVILSSQSFQDAVRTEFGVSISDEVSTALRALRKEVSVTTRGDITVTEDRPALDVAWDAKGDGRDGNVWMGVSLNPEKAEVVWEDNENNQVVSVENSDSYESLSVIGWRELREIKDHTIDEFDISEETREAFVSGGSTTGVSATENPGSRELTLHFGRRQAKKTKAMARNIKNGFENADDGERAKIGLDSYAREIVFFPNGCDHNLSENYQLANADGVAVANCTVAVWEYLQDTSGLVRVEECLEEAAETSFPTTDGEMTISDAPDNLVFHLVPADAIDVFQREEIMERVAEYFSERIFMGGYDTPTYESVVYAPITYDDYVTMLPKMDEQQIVVGDVNKNQVSIGDVESVRNDTILYAYGRLPEWEQTPELKKLLNLGKDSKFHLHKGGYDLVETLGELHDRGVQPNSLTDDHRLSTDPDN